MPTGGKNTKPAVLKRLHGTKRADRAKNEPMPPAGKLMPSGQIDAMPIAREYWAHFMQTAPLGLLKPVDAPILERLCVALAMARMALDDVIARGMVVKSPDKGVEVQNPYLAIVNRQTEIARKLACELALPVVARARVDMGAARPPVDKENDESRPGRDDLEKFLDQRPGRNLQ